MLSQQLLRVKLCRSIDEIVVATTTDQDDAALVALAEQEEVRWYRGSEWDVLGRYLGAARESRADVIVRMTADCPLIDPEVTDRVVGELTSHAAECDYASNVQERTYPRGLDAEAMFRDTLERLGRLATDPADLEHVTLFLRSKRPDLFLICHVKDSADNSNLRWTVDTAEDLNVVRAIYHGLGLGERVLSYREVLAYVLAHPEISLINADVQYQQY